MAEKDSGRLRPIAWSVLVILTALPCFAAVIFLSNYSRLALRLAIVVSIAVPVLGLWRRWATPKGLRRTRWIAGLIVVVSSLIIANGIMKIKRRGEASVVMSYLHGITAGLEQFNLESESCRLFVTYDEIIGPGRYLKNVGSAVGEDYHTLFPVRLDVNQALRVKLPDGRIVQRTEILLMTLPDGRQVSWAVLDDPVGRRQDGVHIVPYDSGGPLYEITYHGGVPDGPFRAFYSDGLLKGETTYVRGRIVGPCWLYTRDGKKFNELIEGPAAEAAVRASFTSNPVVARKP